MFSMSRRFLLKLSVPAILSGCIGPSNSETAKQGSETPTSTEYPSSTETPTEVATSSPIDETERRGTEDCPVYLSVEVATEEQIAETENKIDFQDLHPERQEEFLEARKGASIEIGLVMPPTWRDPVIVYYEGVEHEEDDYIAMGVTC